MASYKVPQDVEADDKLIGFLSMKQFIFVVIAAILSFAAFQLGRVNIVLIAPFLPFIFIFGVLGLYQRKDQPVETYLLAVVTFYFKPHKRKWDQDGVMETVNITAPKKNMAVYTDGLSKTDVRSNLDRLSRVMDTRGWVAKNAEFQTNMVVPNQNMDDRLVSFTQTTAPQPEELHASDDMLDVANNPTAQNFDALMQQASKYVREDAVTHMNDPSSQNLHYNPAPAGIHQKVISPSGEKKARTTSPGSQPPSPNPSNTSTMTPPTSDAILELANRRDDNLSVETISKEAQRMQTLDNNETISLH